MLFGSQFLRELNEGQTLMSNTINQELDRTGNNPKQTPQSKLKKITETESASQRYF